MNYLSLPSSIFAAAAIAGRASFLVLVSLLMTIFGGLIGCGSDADELFDLADIALDPPEEQTIDTSRVGVNSFFNTAGVGSTRDQFLDIRDNLKIQNVRALFAWTNGVQPSPNSEPDYGFFDSILDSTPAGVNLLVTVAHTPDWMTDPANWIGGDPILTWNERWLRPLLQRYAGDPRISSWQIFNEPDLLLVPSDVSLNLADPANYFRLLEIGSGIVRTTDPGKIVVMAASRSIQQDGGNNLDYNKRLKELGAEALVDVWAFHFYGEQFERVIERNGVADFLNSISRPLWITESGEMGHNNQLSYVRTVWPFLRSEIPGLDRIYYFRYASNEPADITFALRTPQSLSDLYIRLRDGAPAERALQ